jgi:hypothetical protein
MNPSLRLNDWVATLNREYLSTFISQGGAAVKFAVPETAATAENIAAAIASASTRLGYVTAAVNAADLRVHMADQVFLAVARATPWEDLTSRVVSRLVAKAGYENATASPGALFEQLATANRIDSRVLLMELRRSLTAEVFSRNELSKDFRVAMTQLCLGHLAGGAAGDTTKKAILEWVRGENTSIAAVKPYHIFNRITRSNARHLLESLLHWVRFAGLAGTVVTMDISRLGIGKNPRDERVFYTKAAVLDAFELLRQFIDGTDRSSGLLLVAIADSAFLEETNTRGINAYGALRARIFDEVRDEKLVNPLASLVRVAES